MLYENIIVDTNNAFWRSTVTAIKKAMQDENDEREFYSASIQDTLIRIQDFMKQYGTKDCKVYMLCDNPFSKINQREEIYSSYKHARKNKNVPIVFYKSLDKLIEILKIYHNNFYVVRAEGCEADDLVPIVLSNIDSKENTILISSDMDWGRSITQKIHWFNYDRVYDIDTFKSDYGFNPDNHGVKMYKCIHGDKSDCIENAVPYLPREILLYIVDKYNSVQDLFSNLWSDDNIPKQWKLKIKDHEVQLKINYQLVDFIPLEKSFQDIAYKCKQDIERLRNWFRLLDIPFFNFMWDVTRDSDNFFEKKKFRRYSNL